MTAQIGTHMQTFKTLKLFTTADGKLVTVERRSKHGTEVIEVGTELKYLGDSSKDERSTWMGGAHTIKVRLADGRIALTHPNHIDAETSYNRSLKK